LARPEGSALIRSKTKRPVKASDRYTEIRQDETTVQADRVGLPAVETRDKWKSAEM